MQRYWLTLSFLLACFPAWSESECVFRRVLKGEMLSASEDVEVIPDSMGKARNEILASFKERQWPDAVLWADLLETTEEQPYRVRFVRVSKRELTADFPGAAKIVFERKVHTGFVLASTKNLIDVCYPKTLAVDQVLQSIQNRTWARDVMRVEALVAKDGSPVVRVISVVGQDMVVREQEFLLSEKIGKEWGIGHDTENFIYDKNSFRALLFVVEELYKNREGARVWVVHRRIDPDDADDHGLFSRVLSTGSIMCRVLTFQDTEAGRALFAHFTMRGGKKIVERHVMWRTAPEHIVDVVYRTESVDDVLEIIRVYAKAFPSTIPATLKIDKTGWGRAEVALRLKGMQEALAKEPDPFDPIRERFERDLGLLNGALQSPVGRAAEGNDERKQQLATLEQWWKENADKTAWDDEAGRLTVGREEPAIGDK